MRSLRVFGCNTDFLFILLFSGCIGLAEMWKLNSDLERKNQSTENWFDRNHQLPEKRSLDKVLRVA